MLLSFTPFTPRIKDYSAAQCLVHFVRTGPCCVVCLSRCVFGALAWRIFSRKREVQRSCWRCCQHQSLLLKITTADSSSERWHTWHTLHTPNSSSSCRRRSRRMWHTLRFPKTEIDRYLCTHWVRAFAAARRRRTRSTNKTEVSPCGIPPLPPGLNAKYMNVFLCS